MSLDDLIYRILNSGRQAPNRLAMAGASEGAAPGNMLASLGVPPSGAFQAASMFAPSDPNSAPRMPQQQAAQDARTELTPAGGLPDGTIMGDPIKGIPTQTPRQRDEFMRQHGFETGRPRRSGGGIGGFIENTFMPQRRARNETVDWLIQSGLDEGVATLLAGNKQALQEYLLQKVGSTGPTEFDQRAQAAARFGLTGEEAQKFILSGDLEDSERDIINAGKGRLYDPNTGQWLTAPDMGTDAPTVQTFYDKEGREYKAQWDAQERKWVPVGGSKLPSGMSLRTNPDGTVEFVQGAGAGQKLTEQQSKDVVYYTRGLDANTALQSLETELTDWTQENAGKIPLGLGNYVRDPSFRQAKQAADSFLAAILRKDTGAAITKQEFDLYGPMFLPVPGDDPGTIAQKRRAREVALLAIRSGLGTAEAIAEANRIMLGAPEVGNLGAPSSRAGPQANPKGKTNGWREVSPGVRIREK